MAKKKRPYVPEQVIFEFFVSYLVLYAASVRRQRQSQPRNRARAHNAPAPSLPDTAASHLELIRRVETLEADNARLRRDRHRPRPAEATAGELGPRAARLVLKRLESCEEDVLDGVAIALPQWQRIKDRVCPEAAGDDTPAAQPVTPPLLCYRPDTGELVPIASLPDYMAVPGWSSPGNFHACPAMIGGKPAGIPTAIDERKTKLGDWNPGRHERQERQGA